MNLTAQWKMNFEFFAPKIGRSNGSFEVVWTRSSFCECIIETDGSNLAIRALKIAIEPISIEIEHQSAEHFLINFRIA